VLRFSLHLLSDTILILRRNQRGIIVNIHWALCTVHAILVTFWCNFNFRNIFSKKNNIKFHENESRCSMRTDTLTDGRADRRIDRPTYDDANSSFSQFCERDTLACSGCNTSHRNSPPGRYERLGTRQYLRSDAARTNCPIGYDLQTIPHTALTCWYSVAKQSKKEETTFFTVQNTVCSRDSGLVPIELRQ